MEKLSLEERFKSLMDRAKIDEQLQKELQADPTVVLERELGLSSSTELNESELKAVSGGAPARRYTCSTCGKRYNSEQEMILHRYYDHLRSKYT